MRPTRLIYVLLPVAALFLAGCGSSSDGDSATDAYASAPACPADPVSTVVSVDQWGDVVAALGGRCAEVTTVLKSSSVDPHDYEPTAADIVKFDKAELVVVNGVDYDPWASKAASNAEPAPAVVDGGEVTGVGPGANPHLWYSPDYVTEIADAVTAQFKKLAPASADYYDARAREWKTSMKPYFDTVAAIKSAHAGATYVATETVFDYMGDALGLTNVTPEGFRQAAANESDPAPGDISAFDEVLTSDGADLLVYNTQTEGSITEQIKRTAESASVPVVNVTESVPPGFDTFVTWQVSQLDDLQKALGGS